MTAEHFCHPLIYSVVFSSNSCKSPPLDNLNLFFHLSFHNAKCLPACLPAPSHSSAMKALRKAGLEPAHSRFFLNQLGVWGGWNGATVVWWPVNFCFKEVAFCLMGKKTFIFVAAVACLCSLFFFDGPVTKVQA